MHSYCWRLLLFVKKVQHFILRVKYLFNIGKSTVSHIVLEVLPVWEVLYECENNSTYNLVSNLQGNKAKLSLEFLELLTSNSLKSCIWIISAFCKDGCRNGGACIAANVCACPQGFTGPSCETGKNIILSSTKRTWMLMCKVTHEENSVSGSKQALQVQLLIREF